MRWLRGIGALLSLVVVLAGSPVLLVSWGRLGVPSWWMRADDGSLLLVVLTVAGWLAWGAFVVAVGLEIARMLGGHRYRVDLPLLGGLQAVCATLILAVVALAAAGGASRTADEAQPSGDGQHASRATAATAGTIPPGVPADAGLPSSAAVPTMDTAAGASASASASTAVLDGQTPVGAAANSSGRAASTGVLVPGTSSATRPPTSPTTFATGATGAATVPAAPVGIAATSGPATTAADSRSAEGYLVEPGDDLWTVADRLLGDGLRWRELVAANPETLTDPTAALVPGTRLRLPAIPLAADQPKQVTVVRGDTLSGLAAEHLGKASWWPRIATANAELIEDPDHIEVGWELTLPAKPADAGSPPEPAPEPSDDRAEPAPAAPEPTTDEAGRTADEPTVDDAAGDSPSPAPGRADLMPGAVPESAVTVPGSAVAVPGPAGATPESAVSAPERADPPPGSAASRTNLPTEAAPSVPEPAVGDDQHALDTGLIGSVSTLAAAGLVGGWEARRLLQGRARAPGRRVAQPDANAVRFHTALGRRQSWDLTTALTSALRAIGRHHHQTGESLPGLDAVLATTESLEFRWVEPAGKPPLGFDGDDLCWRVGLGGDDPPPGADDNHPCAYPALVSLGTDAAGATMMVDLERTRVLGVAADTRELQLASLASMAVELACAPWAAEVSLTVVGPDAEFSAIAGGDAVAHIPSVADALTTLRRRHLARVRALAGQDLRRLRVDPNRAEAVAPEVFVFHEPLDPAAQSELDELLAGSPAGVYAVLAAAGEAPANWQLHGDPLRPAGRFADRAELAAHAIPGATRDAVASLCRVADCDQTEPAGWWAEPESNVHPLRSRAISTEDPVETVRLRRVLRPHPTLLLIGPVDLTGAAGPEPTRSRGPLMEMCGWLLEHPGRTATQMVAGLGIAESTRRSNMSRLRGWLGADEDGEAYLPEAYSGRIRLHPEVTSDIQQLRLLTGPGVNRIAESALVAVLDLIRGGALADTAPGQWFWAEVLRSDLVATLRDAGLVLVDQALTRGDVDLARWAAERALVVAPEDELLACARIRTEQAAGNRAAVQRLVARLSQQARELGVDLLPETVMLCQQVVEGRGRLRRA